MDLFPHFGVHNDQAVNSGNFGKVIAFIAQPAGHVLLGRSNQLLGERLPF